MGRFGRTMAINEFSDELVVEKTLGVYNELATRLETHQS